MIRCGFLYKIKKRRIERKRGMTLFEKKEYIYSDTMGVCIVADIVKLSANNRLGEPVPYYLLRSAFDKSKVAYIPVEKHQVNLRPLISKEEAGRFSLEDLEKMDEKRRAEVQFVLSEQGKSGK